MKRSFATRLARLERFVFATLVRFRFARLKRLGLAWFRGAAIPAFRPESGALIGLGTRVFVFGAIAPTDGGALDIGGRQNLQLGFFHRRGWLGLRRTRLRFIPARCRIRKHFGGWFARESDGCRFGRRRRNDRGGGRSGLGHRLVDEDGRGQFARERMGVFAHRRNHRDGGRLVAAVGDGRGSGSCRGGGGTFAASETGSTSSAERTHRLGVACGGRLGSGAGGGRGSRGRLTGRILI